MEEMKQEAHGATFWGGGVGTILRLQRTTYKIGNTSKSETEQKLPSNF